MKAAQLINDAQHWRNRAQHMRFLAGLVQDAGARRKMLDVAESYERLASRAEKRNPTLVRTKHSAGSLSRAWDDAAWGIWLQLSSIALWPTESRAGDELVARFAGDDTSADAIDAADLIQKVVDTK